MYFIVLLCRKYINFVLKLYLSTPIHNIASLNIRQSLTSVTLQRYVLKLLKCFVMYYQVCLSRSTLVFRFWHLMGLDNLNRKPTENVTERNNVIFFSLVNNKSMKSAYHWSTATLLYWHCHSICLEDLMTKTLKHSYTYMEESGLVDDRTKLKRREQTEVCINTLVIIFYMSVWLNSIHTSVNIWKQFDFCFKS